MSVKVLNSLLLFSIDTISNLSLVTFNSGQMVTVGNGITEMGASFWANAITTGFSCHRRQISKIDILHRDTDKPNAISHHNLDWERKENAFVGYRKSHREQIEMRKFQHLSVQCCFCFVKYRTPWMVLFEQNSANNFPIA